MEQEHSVAGAILGCAVGDAIGLPYEGLSKRRGNRFLKTPLNHRFVAGRGMVSDDTEHTCIVAEALCASPTNANRFSCELGSKLRWWLLGAPAGIGWATLRAIVKLWLGFKPSRSGVFSAGNGPAMRSAVLGAAIDEVAQLREFVRASTVITHNDPKAFHGALAIALAAWCAKRGINEPGAFFAQYRTATAGELLGEFSELMQGVEQSLAIGDSTARYADKIGCGRGVSGYVYRTVPVALHCWLSHPQNYELAVTELIQCGGDTDTTAAIVGAVVGAGLGPAGIPPIWLQGLWEWPHSVAWMERLAEATTEAARTGAPTQPPMERPWIRVLRNFVFVVVVLGHVARRLLPPY